MPPPRLPLLAALLGGAAAQQLDTGGADDTANSRIPITVNGRTYEAGVMLDAQWRWLHDGESKTCKGAAGDMERCFLQGSGDSKYASTYGVQVGQPRPDGVTLRYACQGPDSANPNYGQRVYLTTDEGYMMFKLLGGEITFTVDLTKVPAGMNAAIYLVSMDPSGHLGSVSPSGVENTAGWKRGVGYCDAQCPNDVGFVQGSGYNADGRLHSCCPEMDLFEANRFTTAMTAHPCRSAAESVCTSSDSAVCRATCDTDGADVNPFRRGGPGNALFELLDPLREVQVRTSFRTDDGSTTGTLVRIEQVFEQVLEDGSKRTFGLNLTDESAAGQKYLFGEEDAFSRRYGGLARMGEALKEGMVMVLALWADGSSNMNWLDSCMANETLYSCSANSKFSDAVWSAAQAARPGSWRGPADFYPSLAGSMDTRTVTFSYPAIPAPWKSQAKFSCDADCSNVDYQFVVRDIRADARDSEPVVLPVRSRHGGTKWWFIVTLAVGTVLFVCGCIAVLVCWEEGPASHDKGGSSSSSSSESE